MSEFASGGAHSSLGGQSLNPHDLTRSPSGSSGGTGVAIAAAYAPLGFGTDTGGSIRGPSSANGIVGLKPTHGLLSRSGIIPLALSFDTGGPMARSVSDVAVALGVLTGVDPADPATKTSEGQFQTDYTQVPEGDALKGARIGIARDFLGADPDVDWVVDASLDAMRKAGATIVDVRYPKWLLEAKEDFYTAIRYPEFPAQIAQYLATLGPEISEDARRDDRARQPVHGDARRRRGPESEPLESVQDGSEERIALRLPLHVGPGLRPADGARGRRRHPRVRRSSTRSSIRPRLAGPVSSPRPARGAAARRSRRRPTSRT